MFKWLLENSLTNRLLVLIAAAVLMAYGAFTLSRTPVDVFPDLNKPTVTLMTEAGGMAAEEVEQLITLPLEQAMSGLPGVASVRSTSGVGLSFVYVQFDFGVDIHRARQFESRWFTDLDLIIAFDAPTSGSSRPGRDDDARSKVHLLMSFDPAHNEAQLDVPDPYYSDTAMFDGVLAMIERSCAALFRQLEPGIRQGVTS